MAALFLSWGTEEELILVPFRLRLRMKFVSRLLTGDMLHEVVQKKSPSSGSLDGWGWREFKALPLAWFDKLVDILTLVEEDGVWPDGLLDGYISMIPKD